MVWFYSYSLPKPGPFRGTVFKVYTSTLVDIKMDSGEVRDCIQHRRAADSFRMWDWPVPEGFTHDKGGH